jgi:hypothetical protein
MKVLAINHNMLYLAALKAVLPVALPEASFPRALFQARVRITTDSLPFSQTL